MTDQADTIQRLRALVYQQGDELERLRAELARRPEQPAEPEQDKRCETCGHWRRHDYPSAQWGWCRHWSGERAPWSWCDDSWTAKGGG